MALAARVLDLLVVIKKAHLEILGVTSTHANKHWNEIIILVSVAVNLATRRTIYFQPTYTPNLSMILITSLPGV